MSIPSQIVRQRDFSAGEIDPFAERRDDAEMFKAGVKFARNMQTRRTGQIERRYGRRRLYNDDGVRDDFRPFNETAFSLTFAVSRVTIRNDAGAVVADLAAPWTDPFAITWEFFENRVFVCGNFRPQVIEAKEDGTWSIAIFDFAEGLANKIHAPFYRFPETKDITMRPSALTGSITVTFSAPVLNAAHVGAIFRYANRQLRITAVTSSTVGTALVLENLHPSIQFELEVAAEMNGFAVGDIVESTGSGMQVEAVIITPQRVNGVVLNRYRKKASGDRLIAPAGDAEIDVITFVTPPLATTQWDEIFMSNYRGWPRSVSADNQRLIFTDFPQHKSAVIWSATNATNDFLVTADATGAIFEFLQADSRIYHVIGGYDEFAITDGGVYYIPISGENPLKPGSVEFRKIYSGEVSSVRPVQVTEGVLFVDASLTGIFAVTATGQTARPYVAQEINEFHRHLFSGIRSLAATAGTPKASSRQIFVVNDEGSVVIGQYNTSRGFVGWLKWDGYGDVQHVSSRRNAVVLSTIYPIGAGLAVAEQIDAARLLDCSIDASAGPFPFLANATVQVVADGFYFGNRVLTAGGALTGFGDYANVTIGFNFEWRLVPYLPAFEGGEAYGQRMRRRKVAKVMIKVRETTEFRCGNRLFAGYEAGDDEAQPMPMRNEVYRYRQLGRSYDPEYELAQTIPGPFTLQELTTEVTV